MRYFTLLALCLSLGLPAFGQDLDVQTPTREIGIRFFSLDNFGFIYKRAKGENKFARYSLAAAQFNFSDSGESTFGGDIGFAIGREKRKSISDRLWFIHGPEPNLYVTFQSSGSPVARINPGFNYILGFQYDLSDQFYLNIESGIGISAQLDIQDQDREESIFINTGFTTGRVGLSAIYRF